MKSRVELLAPAGNYEAFLGAVNAGADAVYLGGEKFGARAYADNFTTEEICLAIHTAHFMGKKIYLTVNTLVKETEFAEVYDWLLPFYEAGLDGVIVQDIGILCYIREHFEGLALHASTQMTLTGAGGASFLKEQGVERIVPARELSLAEVRKIKEQTGLEIECFIHGAMCYCYSGQCLFSSILGGRSGNRGRCAQPCRLPYQIYDGKERIDGVDYPLSLKDMCTISYIPQLIEAGIDSFKIEGRMKKPEYTAGVTALYRKYIDLYEEKGPDGYHVMVEDLEKLRSLYIRSEVQTGYYERHNGREMITLHTPGYAGSNQDMLTKIRSDYVRDVDKLSVAMCVTLKAGEPACLHIIGPQEITVTVYGSTVDAAKKMPLQQESIRKQLEKTGNSLVKVTDCEILVTGDVFLPVSALNELRRKGVENFERQYIIAQGMITERKLSVESMQGEKFRLTESVNKVKAFSQPHTKHFDNLDRQSSIDILVSTYEQLGAAVQYPCRRIYIDSDLYLIHHEQIKKCMGVHAQPEYYLALPYVLRSRDEDYLRRLTELITMHEYTGSTKRQYNSDRSVTGISGFLIRNYEEVSYVKNLSRAYTIVPDAGMYIFNRKSMKFWSNYSGEYTLPYELNAREAKELVDHAHHAGMDSIMIVYSRIPMMISANCIRKTAERCAVKSTAKSGTQAENRLKSDGVMRIRDRYGTDFSVETNCTHCYNIIYNSVPYSLHLQKKEVDKTGADILRYDFTVESGEDCRKILEGREFPYEKYTTGHLKRGVE